MYVYIYVYIYIYVSVITIINIIIINITIIIIIITIIIIIEHRAGSGFLPAPEGSATLESFLLGVCWVPRELHEHLCSHTEEEAVEGAR